jgi:hypothetical protein
MRKFPPRALATAIAMAAAWLPAGVRADGEAPAAAPEPTAAQRFDLGGGYTAELTAAFEERVSATQTSAIQVRRPLGTDPTQLDPHVAFENRLRVGGSASFRHATGFLREVKLELQADVLSGAYTSSLEAEALRFDPLQPSQVSATSSNGQHLRRASVEVTTEAGRLLAGRTVNSWGLGILAQGADDDPLQFGMRRNGHYVTRLAYFAMPSTWFLGDEGQRTAPVVLGVAYDWIAHDDRARRSDGDSGNNWIVTAGWFGKHLQAGFFGVRRTQTNDQGLDTKAWVADVYARGAFESSGWKLALATEWVYITGETEVLRSKANPDSIDVSQIGGALRFDVEKDWFVARLEGGYASGDSRPSDDGLHGFTFASDYRIGVALFPEFQRRISAVAAYNAQDPRFSGEPPVGFDEIPTKGAVAQAMYLHPVLGIRPFPNLTILGGAVLARSAADIADPYQTGLAGGVATGPYGAQGKRNLGIELDAGVRYNQPLGAGLALEARFDAGILFPGDAFDDALGNSASAFAVALTQLMLQGKW